MAMISQKWRWLAWPTMFLAGALGTYALVGFILAPYFVQNRLWPMLSESVGWQIQVENTRFNPFHFTIELDGVSLKDAEGAPFATIGEVGINLDLAASLHARALVVEIQIDQPEVTLRFNKQGQPNFAFLIPKESKEPIGEPLPFLLTELTITEGRLGFEDQSRGKGYKKVLQSLGVGFGPLGTISEAPTQIKLVSQGDAQEKLNFEGVFNWRQMALEGDGKLEGLALAPLAEWLAPSLAPYAVTSGQLSLAMKCRYLPASGFDLSGGEVRVNDLSLSGGKQPFLKSALIVGQALSFQAKTNLAQLKSLSLDSLVLQLPDTAELTALKAQALSYHLSSNQFDVQSVSLDKAALKSATPTELQTIHAEGLNYKVDENWAGVKSLAATKLKFDQGDQPVVETGAVSAQNFAFQITKGRLGLSQLDLEAIDLKPATPVVDKEGNARQFQVGSLSLSGLDMNLPDQTLGLSLLQTNHSFLAFWRNKEGTSGFSGLPPSQPAAPVVSKAKAEAKPWQVRLERVELNDNTILLRDFQFDPPSKMRLSNLNLLVKDFDSTASKPFWLGMNTGLSMNGRIAMEGQIKLSPLIANLKLYVDDLSLPPFQPYLDPYIRIRMVQGALNTNADIVYDEAASHALHIAGDVAVANFASVDKQESRDFLNWKAMRMNSLIFESAPQRLSVRDISFTEPYLLAYIDSAKKLNIAQNVSPPALGKAVSPVPDLKEGAAASKPQGKGKAKAEEPMSVLIGLLNINRGNMDFADFTIKPTPFSAKIRNLNGNIRSLSSRPDAKSDVLLDGQLNEGAPVKIYGKINPLSLQASTDLRMHFQGVNMTRLSAYSAKFAGYRIERGKLTMDLHYLLENGRLAADNNFLAEQLVLGERVESPEATSLPVRMAISLLKDSEGKIDVSLPISGDLSNPNISIGNLLAGAATELISKLVTSPFSILSALVGQSSEELESVKFAPGDAILSNEEKEQLAQIAQIMKKRPGMNLDIKSTADAGLDRPVLAEMDLTRQLKNAKLIELGRKKGKKAEWDGMTLSEEDYNRLFTNFYRWKKPDAEELQGLKAGTYLAGAQVESVKSKLLEKWSINEMDLRGLAQARGEAIRNYLVRDQGLSDQRIYLLDVKLSQNAAKEIKAMLSLSGS